MPIYDFQCRTCGHSFETLVRSQDTPACPSCHGRDLDHLLSTFAVRSADRTKAAATASRKKAAVAAGRDNAALEREAEHHRREDH